VLDFWRSKGVETIQQANNEKLQQAVKILGNAWHGRNDDSVTLVPLSLHAPMMALVRLPESYQTSSLASDDAKRVQDMLFDHFVEVPIKCINNVLYVRISCHIYNELGEYERLAEVILKNSPIS
jgi:selenocysteine lyase/cysteine desulfurase